MTGSDTPSIPLSEKLSQVTHHHLITRVPVKLDLDNWNYSSWEFFFEQLCETYDVSKYIHGFPNANTTSNPTPLTPEELKVDKIILSWIFTTLSETLQARLVVARPKTSKEAWDLILDIVKDNKRSRTNALKAELRSVKHGNQSMEVYFRKIKTIVTVLKSLDSHVNEEDVVHYALEGLPDKYEQVIGIMHHKDTFLDLKTARTMLITGEMRLKSKALTPSMDSSSPTILMAQTSTIRCPSNPQVKSWRPCINFAKGACRYGTGCKFVHDANAKTVSNTIDPKPTSDIEEILLKVLGRLGLTNTNSIPQFTSQNKTTSPNPSVYYTETHPSPTSYTYQSPTHPPHQAQPIASLGPPPGFPQYPVHPTPPYTYTLPTQPNPNTFINQTHPPTPCTCPAHAQSLNLFSPLHLYLLPHRI